MLIRTINRTLTHNGLHIDNRFNVANVLLPAGADYLVGF